jgi:hypothetical protein
VGEREGRDSRGRERQREKDIFIGKKMRELKIDIKRN